MDPGGLTFGELALMAEERKRFLGELTAWQVAMVAGMFGSNLQPTEINPYRVWTAAELRARAEFEKRKFWAGLGVGLFGKNVFKKPEKPECQ